VSEVEDGCQISAKADIEYIFMLCSNR